MNWSSSRQIVWKSVPWLVSTLLVGGLMRLGAFQPLEYFAYNRFTNWRSDRIWDNRLVIIAIDDASIAKLGRFPWARDRYVPLLKKLNQAEASTITVNLIWSEASPADLSIAKVMSAHRQVVLAQAWDAQGEKLLPVPQLADVAIGSGHIHEIKDSDGIVRRTNLYMQDIPSLAMATLQAYNLVNGQVQMPNPDMPLIINWSQRPQKMRQYSFVDVIENRISPIEFKNKIVVVGLTATGYDALVTPFESNEPAHGIHLHATILQNLLQQNILHVPEPSWIWGLMLVGSAIFALLLANCETYRQIAIVITFTIGWGVSTFIFYTMSYWLPVAMPITLIISIGVTSIIQRQIETRQYLQQVNSKLAYDAFHDHLTGLANRILMTDRINHAIALYQRHGHLFAVILLDLDGFKGVNDNLGHAIGDQLLIEVSERLCAAVRAGDTVARLGGDEFVLLLENLKERQDAIITIERIQSLMVPTCRFAEQDIKISVSMGMAFSIDAYRHPKEILIDADVAMYRAKSLGKSCYQIFDPAMKIKGIKKSKHSP